MKQIILDKLKAIEHQFDVRILYACESGSRAWGFASQDRSNNQILMMGDEGGRWKFIENFHQIEYMY